MSLKLNLPVECSSARSPVSDTTAQSFGSGLTLDDRFLDGVFDFRKLQRERVQTPEGDWVEIVIDPNRPRGRDAYVIKTAPRAP